VAQRRDLRVHELWARFRFSVIGQLLAAPPAKGELRRELAELAARQWRHPVSGEPVRLGVSTIERWYYRARRERHDPVGVLRRKLRADAGRQATIGAALRAAVLAQYAAHQSWSARLHHDNLIALAANHPELGTVPSYSTLRRFLEAHGLSKRRRLTSRRTDGAERAEARLLDREVRSFEAAYVNGLWHWDCHHGSKKVLTSRGEWRTPILFGVLDDRSRLACHLQWYLAENAENIAHGLSQAFQKRGLPRAAMSDNGAAMTAAEISEGLARLGILHETTLPYSPYQNAKQEAFWSPVEGRLIAMLRSTSCAKGSKASAPPPASRSPISTSRSLPRPPCGSMLPPTARALRRLSPSSRRACWCSIRSCACIASMRMPAVKSHPCSPICANCSAATPSPWSSSITPRRAPVTFAPARPCAGRPSSTPGAIQISIYAVMANS
jgi:putative transposase